MCIRDSSHVTRYDLELYSLEPLDFCTLDTLNYSEQMPYITHGFLRADRRDSMGFVLLYGKKTVSRWGFRHSVLEVTRRPVCHVLLQRCAGADMLDDAAAQAQLDEAAQLLTEAGFVQYLSLIHIWLTHRARKNRLCWYSQCAMR